MNTSEIQLYSRLGLYDYVLTTRLKVPNMAQHIQTASLCIVDHMRVEALASARQKICCSASCRHVYEQNQNAEGCEAGESDSDSDETDEEDLKV